MRRALICPLIGACFEAQKGVILVRPPNNTSLKRGYLKTGARASDWAEGLDNVFWGRQMVGREDRPE